MTAPVITLDHIRGLMARTPRSVLLWDRVSATCVFASPDSAYDRLASGRCRYLCSRQDLEDSGVCRNDDGTLAAGSVARAREFLAALNELEDDGGNGIVDRTGA